MLEQTTVFDANLHLHAIFKMSFENLMLHLPSALSKITAHLFMNDCCLLLSRTLPESLFFKRTLVGERRFRPNVAAVSGRRFRPQAVTSGIRFVFGYSNHRNSRSKSGICCRVRTRVLPVGAVVFACTFPRSFFLLWTTTSLHSKEVEHRSRKV